MVVFVWVGRLELLAQGTGFPVGLQQQIPAGEYDALVNVHSSLSPLVTIPGWLNPEATQWPGVTVSGFNADETGAVLSVGNVSGISLPGLNLTGTIPSSLTSFERLEWLDFSDNQLTGELSGSLGGHLNLRNLNLSSNQLTGSILADLGNLPELGFLDLSHNQLSGVIPEALNGLQRLVELKLHDNYLSGELPDALATMGNLGYINLQGNFFPTNAPSGNKALVEQLVASGDIVLFSPQKPGPKIEYTFDHSLARFTLTFPTVDGLPYKVEYSSDLANWQTLQEDSEGTEFSGTVQVVGSGLYYRVRLY